MAFKWNGAHMVYLFALLMFPSVVTSLETVYCSPQNTGSDFDAGKLDVFEGSAWGTLARLTVVSCLSSDGYVSIERSLLQHLCCQLCLRCFARKTMLVFELHPCR